MTEDRLAVSELLEEAGDGDFLRTAAEAVLPVLMGADADGLIYAGRCERIGERTTLRNGYPYRVLDTGLSDMTSARRSPDPNSLRDVVYVGCRLPEALALTVDDRAASIIWPPACRAGRVVPGNSRRCRSR